MDTTKMFEFPIKEFFKQPRSLFGAGAYEQAGPEAAAMGLSHVLFVTSGLSGTGIVDECKTNFENAGVTVTVYDKVESNPKDYNVMDAYNMFTEKAPHKWVGFDHACTTTLAINDPVLMMTQPPEYVAFTGFDTIAHASEAYVGRVQHLSCTPLALKAVEMVQSNLRQAVYNPNDYNAMEAMTWAQYIAAQAFSSALLGILHSLSHAVCAYYDIHHGLNNGIGIARVWTYNLPVATEKYADIATAMGEDTKGLNPAEAADKAIDAVIRLARECGIPDNFSEVNPNYAKSEMGKGTFYENRPTKIQPDDDELEAMAQHMMEDVCTPGNPRDLTLEAAKEILRDCSYDPMIRKTSDGYRQNIWGADPAMGRQVGQMGGG